MSLPPAYNDVKVYFRDSLRLLREYDWLFRYSNIQILVEGLLECFNDEWRKHLENFTNYELNELPFGYINENWPLSLKNFIQKIESLKPINPLLENEDIDLPKELDRKLSVKKKHEILSLAPFIHKTCEDIDVIVDIGAGLGYLPQILYEKFKYKILAIEGNEEKFLLAQQRQKKYYPQSQNNIKFVLHYVDKDSDKIINNFISDFLNVDSHKLKICLIGLHACADLTITMLRLFKKMENIKNIVVMPCCYHRLKTCDDNMDKFENFPCSEVLRNIYEEEKGSTFLTAPFLRLSGQCSASARRHMTPEEHITHATSVLRRCVLELASQNEGCQVSRFKRKCKTADAEISTYIDGLKNNYSLTDKKTNEAIPIQNIYGAVESTWKKNEHLLNMIEVFTAFQTTLQTIGENIILFDRVWMVREWGWSCDVVKVANDELSSRCYALVAKKQNFVDTHV